MSGYIYCYLGKDATPDLAVFERVFRSIGLHLTQPGTLHVYALSPSGEQYVTTREEVVLRLAEKRDVNLQWWFGALDDVYCGFHTDTLNEQWRVTFRFHAIAADKVEATARQVLVYFKENCAQGDTVALVVDRHGSLAHVDWDSVVVGKATLREIPDVLILPRSVPSSHLDAQRTDFPECPDRVVFSPMIHHS